MDLSQLSLEKPHVRFERTYLSGLQEFRDEGLQWYLDQDHDFITSRFADFVDLENDRIHPKRQGMVPETLYWGICGQKFVGRISIRHALNDNLRRMGGHIGYDVVKSERRKGVGSKMLELVLPHAHQLGLRKLLITCDDNNIGSIKIIEKQGGVLEKKIELSPDKPLKRHYWIELK